MAAAIRAAQATFPEFAREAELERWRKIPAYVEVVIKVFFPHPKQKGVGEHMFVTDVSTDGKKIKGTLSSQPDIVPGLREGQRIVVPIGRLSDWFLVPPGVNGKKAIGGFTIDVMRAEMSPSERARFDRAAPCKWYAHRTGSTAKEELDALPVCQQCDERGLHAYEGPVCPMCANGAARTKCPGCGAPLVRHPGFPPECHQCFRPR